MRSGLVAAFVAACSFQHGTTNEPGSGGGPLDSASGSDAAGGAKLDAPSTIDAAPRVCPAGYVTLTGAPATSKYKVFNWSNSTSQNKSVPWDTAKQTCIGDGTHLAIPNDMNELTALRGNITVDPQSNYFWVGLTDAAMEGTWLTVLGDPAPYTPWYPGQPNNGGGPGGSGQPENCAFSSPAAPNIWDWVCGSYYPFYCECE